MRANTKKPAKASGGNISTKAAVVNSTGRPTFAQPGCGSLATRPCSHGSSVNKIRSISLLYPGWTMPRVATFASESGVQRFDTPWRPSHTPIGVPSHCSR